MGRAKEFSPSKAASSGTGDGALEYGNFVGDNAR